MAVVPQLVIASMTNPSGKLGSVANQSIMVDCSVSASSGNVYAWNVEGMKVVGIMDGVFDINVLVIVMVVVVVLVVAVVVAVVVVVVVVGLGCASLS